MWGINMKNNSYEELDNYMDSLDRGTGSDAIYVSDKLVFLKENDAREMKFLLSTLIYTAGFTLLAVRHLRRHDAAAE